MAWAITMALAHHPFARYMKLRNSPSGHGQHVEFALQKQKPLLEKQLRCMGNWENWDLFFLWQLWGFFRNLWMVGVQSLLDRVSKNVCKVPRRLPRSRCTWSSYDIFWSIFLHVFLRLPTVQPVYPTPYTYPPPCWAPTKVWLRAFFAGCHRDALPDTCADLWCGTLACHPGCIWTRFVIPHIDDRCLENCRARGRESIVHYNIFNYIYKCNCISFTSIIYLYIRIC